MKTRMTPAKWMRAKGYRPIRQVHSPKKAGDLVLTGKGVVQIAVDHPNG